MKPESDKRRLFMISAADTNDALLRVLNVVSVQQARLRRVEASTTGEGLTIALETDDEGDERADLLASRLGACLAVRGVGFGWRM
ncbi:hypothetical protein [Caulobacter sp. NIBR2454]|uniref:hypothetical protein n=1 Tax=Caulobacter sp. NIBR2454 TaxID=3015996 RepID=UPI002FC3A26C